MKIAHLTSDHPPHDIRIFHKQCKSLMSNGYEVALVVKADSDKIIDSVQILSIPEESSRLKRFFYSSWAVYKKAIASKAKICHFHDPELIPTAILLSLRGKKVVYDVHEDLPRQILSKDWIPTWLRYPVSWLAATSEWIGSRLFFSAIVPATPKIASRFPKSKTVLVQNFPILNELGNAKTVILKAFESVKNQDCCFILAGSFSSPALEKECRMLDAWQFVDFRGWLLREEIREMLSKAKAGLVVLHSTLA
ncbi:glycosyl transferase group 1 [Candidatus Thiomargarita nelsonii]|uniref:Glycosyl transferase group 1 n=1 Tax=Candidatus Thiomargarita nelsonii TaxID=1003181 RepID=A0A176RUR5_9GAMM|nr:glycosyl transferase group 1 [Candidatus Thiomargarita nelsonii]